MIALFKGGPLNGQAHYLRGMGPPEILAPSAGMPWFAVRAGRYKWHLTSRCYEWTSIHEEMA